MVGAIGSAVTSKANKADTSGHPSCDTITPTDLGPVDAVQFLDCKALSPPGVNPPLQAPVPVALL